MATSRAWNAVRYGFSLILLTGALLASVLYLQGSQAVDTRGEYVALGSSFAAGLGLGMRAAGSPYICGRSTGGYPTLLSRRVALRLVDMTCSGSTTAHILNGGQFFLGPQLDAVGPETRLVTITSGGNDVGYVGALGVASSKSSLVSRTLGTLLRKSAEPDYLAVAANLERVVRTVRARAPKARVVIVSYPQILPAVGTCDELGMDAVSVQRLRAIGTRLSDASRLAAERGGAEFVDMDRLSEGHDVCGHEPWIHGAAPGEGAAFHPNAQGARAVADAVATYLLARSAGQRNTR